MLVFSLLISLFVPELKKRVRGLSPLMFSIVLAIPALGVMLHRTRDATVTEQELRPATTGLIEMSGASEQAAQAAGTGGAIFMVSVIGIVALIAVARLFIRMRNAQALGLAAVLIATGFGLIFHGPAGEAPVAADATAPVISGSEIAAAGRFFAFDAGQSAISVQASGFLQSGFAISVLWLTVVVLLSSLLVILTLPNFSAAVKRIALWWFAVGACACVLAMTLFPALTGGTYLFGDLSDYHVALFVGVVLFVLSGPLVQSPLRNVSQLFIVILCVSVSGSVLLLATSGTTTAPDNPAEFATPILDAPEIERALPETYPRPHRAEQVAAEPTTHVRHAAFAVLLILLVQYVVGRAMGETSFRNFWPYLPITALAILTGGVFAYALGISLWKIVAVLAVGIPSTPLVLHVFKTYRNRRSRSRRSSRFVFNPDALLEKDTA